MMSASTGTFDAVVDGGAALGRGRETAREMDDGLAVRPDVGHGGHAEVAAGRGMDDTMQAYAVLAPYMALGIVPVVVPSFIPEVKIVTKGFDSQTGTHLQHLKKLARANGFVFYVEPGPLPGQSIAYLGPNIRIPAPQPALSVNMDAHTNLEQLSFSLDGLLINAGHYYVGGILCVAEETYDYAGQPWHRPPAPDDSGAGGDPLLLWLDSLSPDQRFWVYLDVWDTRRCDYRRRRAPPCCPAVPSAPRGAPPAPRSSPCHPAM
jgi:hypothetical protein